MEKPKPTTTASAQATAADAAGAKAGPVAVAAAPGGGLPALIALAFRVIAHWPVALVAFVIGAAGTLYTVRGKQPVYLSEAVIFYRQGAVVMDNAQTSADILRSLGTKLKEMAMAKSNLELVIKRFDLYHDLVAKRGTVEAVEAIRGKIEFKAKTNDTFSIGYKGSTPEEAQKLAQGIAEMIVERNTETKRERARDAQDFLQKELTRTSDELAKLEQELATFLTDHPEFTGDRPGQGAAIRNEIRKVGAGQSAAGSAMRRAMSGGGRRLLAGAGAPSLGGGHGMAAAPVDPVLLAAHSQAMAELIASKRDFADKSLKYTEQHPDVRAAATRLAAAESQLQKSETAIRAAQPPPASAEPENPYGDGTEEPVRAMRPPPKVDPVVQTPDSEIVTLEMVWARLSRDLNTSRLNQAQLENRLFNAEFAASSEFGGYAATIVVLEPAFKPFGAQGTPKRSMILGGLFGSVILGLGVAAARGLFLDDRIFTAYEIENMGLVPVLGIVPRRKVVRSWKKPRTWLLRG